MADVVSPAVRSRMMAGIGGKNSKPEILIRKMLFSAGYRFRLHRRDLPGTPDIVLPGRKIVIFVHGCFWHAHERCRYFKIPATRTDFWIAKLQSNVNRDMCNVGKLTSTGWRVLCIWECATRDSATAKSLLEQIVSWIDSDIEVKEIGAPLTQS
jgi:DNA mismatch endonuclease (patch repair protein)